jgi:hypothetical protein
LAFFLKGVAQPTSTTSDFHLKTVEETWGLFGHQEFGEVVLSDLVSLVLTDSVVKRSDQVVIWGRLLAYGHLCEMNMGHIHLLNFIESQESRELFTVAINVRSVVWLSFSTSCVKVTEQILDKLNQNLVNSVIE